MAGAGDLDTSFDGNGKKAITFGAVDSAEAVLVQPNGRIVVAGGGATSKSFCVARLRSNGTLDPTFGSRGKRVIGFGGDDFGLAMARQANGRILVAGESRPTEIGAAAGGAVVTRLRAIGELDPDFDGDGRLMLAAGGRANAVLVQPDRRIVVAATAAGFQTMTVTRLMPNGSPDPTFDGDGTATIAFPSVLAAGAALQGDGRIVVAGSSAGDFAVARLNADGSPDTTFGAAGKATVDFGAATFAHGMALQANGRIVVVGQRTAGDDFAIARLLG